MARKAALLFGLNYSNAPDATIPRLNATLHDVVHVRDYLRSAGYTDVTVETDADAPLTRQRFLRELQRFVTKTTADSLDVAVLYYSGHGTQVPASWLADKPAEPEDECVVASDDLIVDNEFQSMLQAVNPNTRFVFVADCCHSGTLADLQYTYEDVTAPAFDQRMQPVAAKLILLAGCKDDQLSGEGEMDLSVAPGREDVRPSGFMTGALLSALRRQPSLNSSLLRLFAEIQRQFREALSDPAQPQKPVLNCSFVLAPDTALF